MIIFFGVAHFLEQAAKLEKEIDEQRLKKDRNVSGEQFEKQKREWEEVVRKEKASLNSEKEELIAKINKMKIEEEKSIKNKVGNSGILDSKEIEILKQSLLLEQEEFKKVIYLTHHFLVLVLCFSFSFNLNFTYINSYYHI